MVTRGSPDKCIVMKKGRMERRIKQVKWINDEWHFHYLLDLLISFLSPLSLFPLAVCFSSRLLDPAVDDFVLMHGVFMPNSQLCPLLMAQYPFCLYSLFMYDVIHPVSVITTYLVGALTNLERLTTPLRNGRTCLLFTAYYSITVLLSDSILDCATYRFCLWKRWSSSWPSSTNELLTECTPLFTP